MVGPHLHSPHAGHPRLQTVRHWCACRCTPCQRRCRLGRTTRGSSSPRLHQTLLQECRALLSREECVWVRLLQTLRALAFSRQTLHPVPLVQASCLQKVGGGSTAHGCLVAGRRFSPHTLGFTMTLRRTVTHGFMHSHLPTATCSRANIAPPFVEREWRLSNS